MIGRTISRCRIVEKIGDESVRGFPGCVGAEIETKDVSTRIENCMTSFELE